MEIHECAFLKLALKYMDIELSVPFEEASEGIRTGVISNLCFSGKVLKYQLDRLLSNNKFEFTLASSDYIFRKPDSIMFEIALRKAGLTADKVWYCGDSIEADIYGAKSVNMFPVLYSG